MGFREVENQITWVIEMIQPGKFLEILCFPLETIQPSQRYARYLPERGNNCTI